MQESARSSDDRYEVSSERRSATRIPQVELQCSLGQVLDITSTGLRVLCKRVPKDKWVKFNLNSTVDPIPVHAKIVWTKKVRFRRHEIGLRFVESSSEIDKLVQRCSTLDGKVWQWHAPE